MVVSGVYGLGNCVTMSLELCRAKKPSKINVFPLFSGENHWFSLISLSELAFVSRHAYRGAGAPEVLVRYTADFTRSKKNVFGKISL